MTVTDMSDFCFWIREKGCRFLHRDDIVRRLKQYGKGEMVMVLCALFKSTKKAGSEYLSARYVLDKVKKALELSDPAQILPKRRLATFHEQVVV